MENSQEQEVVEQKPEEVTTSTEVKPDSVSELVRVSEMRHKMLSQLLEISLHNYGLEMIKNNKNSFNRKIQLMDSLIRAFSTALDYGLNITGKTLVTEGPLKNEEKKLTELLIQSFDNRFLLIANKIGEENGKKEA